MRSCTCCIAGRDIDKEGPGAVSNRAAPGHGPGSRIRTLRGRGVIDILKG